MRLNPQSSLAFLDFCATSMTIALAIRMLLSRISKQRYRLGPADIMRYSLILHHVSSHNKNTCLIHALRTDVKTRYWFLGRASKTNFFARSNLCSKHKLVWIAAVSVKSFLFQKNRLSLCSHLSDFIMKPKIYRS